MASADLHLPSTMPVRIYRRAISNWRDGLLTIGGLALIVYVAWLLLQWGIFNAVWKSPDGTSEVCRGIDGACWAVIDVRWRLILFGLFPHEEHWRSALACLAILAVVVLSCVTVFWSAKRLAALWFVGFGTFYILMRGGVLGMTPVFPEQWGGLSLNVFIFSAVAVIGMPLSICFALMRRSELPVIAKTTGIIIDGVRSLPLVTILFAFAVILPLAVPDILQGDKIWRVIIGFALFFAAYQAEVLRSGIQALPAGQEEAAKALGLGYWQRISRIVLPQAFRNALPPTINQFVITFKETSLVVIIGFFDILASGNAAYGTGEWSFAYVEVYVFIALVFFVFVFSLSRYGAFLERRLRVSAH